MSDIKDLQEKIEFAKADVEQWQRARDEANELRAQASQKRGEAQARLQALQQELAKEVGLNEPVITGYRGGGITINGNVPPGTVIGSGSVKANVICGGDYKPNG